MATQARIIKQTHVKCLDEKTAAAKEEHDRELSEAEAEYAREIAAAELKKRKSMTLIETSHIQKINQYQIEEQPIIEKAIRAERLSLSKKSELQDVLRFSAESSYSIIHSKLPTHDAVDPRDIVILCQYLGFDVHPTTTLTGQRLMKLTTESGVKKQLGIKAFGDCRRFINAIDDIKSGKSLKPYHDISTDGADNDYTAWSVGQVGAWASGHDMAGAVKVLAKHNIAGDVMLNLDVDEFFLGSDFPEELQHSFEKKIEALRHAGEGSIV